MHDDLFLRDLARKIVRKRLRRIDEDIEQEVWIAGWMVRDQSEGYVVRSMQNRLIDCLAGASLGSRRQNAGGRGKRHLTSGIMALDAIETPLDERPSLGVMPHYPSDVDWAMTVALTRKELRMILDLLEWNVGTRTRHGYRPFSASKGEWPPLKAKLTQAWKEAMK